MLTQDEIDDWYFDTPRRKIFSVKPSGEPVDYEKLKRYPKIMKAFIESGD